MKNIQKLTLLLSFIVIASLSIIGSDKGSYDNDDERTMTHSSSLKSTDSSYDNAQLDENGVGFFIEKPTVSWKNKKMSWKTKTFKNPVVVQGQAFYNHEGQVRLQIIQIPTSIYFNYMPEVAYKDFIPCDGPIGEVDFDEYQEIVAEYAPEYYQKLQRQATRFV